MSSRPADAAPKRRYMGEDLMVASELNWLLGHIRVTDPEIVPNVERALRYEQEMRDRYYDALRDLDTAARRDA